jgi:hypothetical protein
MPWNQAARQSRRIKEKSHESKSKKIDGYSGDTGAGIPVRDQRSCGNAARRQATLSPSAWGFQAGGAHLLQAALVKTDDQAAIVGFWHVKFVSEGSTGIPNGTEIDAGYSQLHSDGTEIMNSGGRSPITSNFCLGVWKQTRTGTYKLNHFATAWDPTGTILIGPANIREEVTLASDGNRFSGKFTIDQYDESGNNLGQVQGQITGTRITPETPAQSIF